MKNTVDETLFRMNFIVQDNAASTLDANLVKIIEAVLYDSTDPLSVTELCNRISDSYELSFSVSEIESAIKRKGKHIQFKGEQYSLIPSYSESLKQKGSFSGELRRYVSKCIRELSLEINEDDFCNLLTEYLYYCFNSNKDALLSLIQNEVVEVSKRKAYDNNQIKNINAFLSWDNDDKNKFIYNTISYGYIYCTLTVKKDSLLANKLFKGKRFILDANILFRLAGINNDARRFTINSFVTKCKEVGIELCYTSDTLDEIFRVIKNKVQWIRGITNYQKPLDLSEYDSGENDFYKIYCVWSKNGHSYDDYAGFQAYLNNLMMSVLKELSVVEIANSEITEKERYIVLFDSLKTYKYEHTYREQSKASLKTDVNNIMYVQQLRSNYQNKNIWSTQEYFISADQNLIQWSSDISSGVPIVVLPSLWLTIILRYTGRSDNDYKAFCSFLELRTHFTPDAIDIYQLVSEISTKTSCNELKEKIVKEVYDHKTEYFLDEDITNEKIAEKAFDAVMKQMSEDEAARVAELEEELKNKCEEKSLAVTDIQLQKQADDAKKLQVLVERDTKKKFAIWDTINKIKLPGAFIIYVILIINAICLLLKIGPIYGKLIAYNNEFSSMSTMIELIGIIGSAVGGLSIFANLFFKYMSSEKRKDAYRDKQEQYYRGLLNIQKTSN